MSQPTRAMIHIDRPLTNISIAYMQNPNDFVADKVFPMVPVSKQSDKYFTYDIGDWYRTDTQRRAPGTESAGSGFEMSTDNYFCEIYALHKDIDDPSRANQDQPIDLDRDAAQFLSQDMMISREAMWVNTFFTTSKWTGSTTASDITPSNLWDTVASTPIQDVDDQRTSIKQKTGYMPNTLVMGYEVYKDLKNHPDILDRIKYTQRGVVTPDLLAGLFDVERVLIASGVRNTAAQGATDSLSFLLGKHALLLYVERSPGIMKPSGGYTFVWRGLANNNMGMGVKRFRMENLESDRVEIQSAHAQKLVAANLGVFFSSVVS